MPALEVIILEQRVWCARYTFFNSNNLINPKCDMNSHLSIVPGQLKDIFVDSIVVTAAHYEQPYDHVHHSNIIRLLELSRNRFLEHHGESFQKWYDLGVAMVISSISVQYLREIREGNYGVRVAVTGFTDRVCGFAQEIVNSKNKVAVRAGVEVAFMSLKERRGVRCPEELKAAIPVQSTVLGL
jgi:acyl-CoA thioesterase FadM